MGYSLRPDIVNSNFIWNYPYILNKTDDRISPKESINEEIMCKLTILNSLGFKFKGKMMHNNDHP